jgi:hypothetical protein
MISFLLISNNFEYVVVKTDLIVKRNSNFLRNQAVILRVIEGNHKRRVLRE